VRSLTSNGILQFRRVINCDFRHTAQSYLSPSRIHLTKVQGTPHAPFHFHANKRIPIRARKEPQTKVAPTGEWAASLWGGKQESTNGAVQNKTLLLDGRLRLWRLFASPGWPCGMNAVCTEAAANEKERLRNRLHWRRRSFFDQTVIDVRPITSTAASFPAEFESESGFLRETYLGRSLRETA
jgi:hypothetical protein